VMVTFDGFEFDMNMNRWLPWIEMAYRARRGDAVAAELLDKFNVVIYNGSPGVNYWPMEAKPQPDNAMEGLR